MSIIKIASTAMARHARNLSPEQAIEFGKKLNEGMEQGKIRSREFEVKPLGRGAFQQADLVMLPGHGMAVRKHYHGKYTPTKSYLKNVNNVQSKINAMNLPTVARRYAIKNEGDPIKQTTYWEFSPGKEAKSKSGFIVDPYKRNAQAQAIVKQHDELQNKLLSGQIQDPDEVRRVQNKIMLNRQRIDNHNRYIRGYMNNPDLSPELKRDIQKIHAAGHPIDDIRTPNIIGGKLVDYEPGLSRRDYIAGNRNGKMDVFANTGAAKERRIAQKAENAARKASHLNMPDPTQSAMERKKIEIKIKRGIIKPPVSAAANTAAKAPWSLGKKLGVAAGAIGLIGGAGYLAHKLYSNKQKQAA